MQNWFFNVNGTNLTINKKCFFDVCRNTHKFWKALMSNRFLQDCKFYHRMIHSDTKHKFFKYIFFSEKRLAATWIILRIKVVTRRHCFFSKNFFTAIFKLYHATCFCEGAWLLLFSTIMMYKHYTACNI